MFFGSQINEAASIELIKKAYEQGINFIARAHKGADQYIIGSMTTVGMITAMILQVPVGRLSDKIGRKKTFFLFMSIYLCSETSIDIGTDSYLSYSSWIYRRQRRSWRIRYWRSKLHTKCYNELGNGFSSEERKMAWNSGSARDFHFPASILGGILWQQGCMIEVLLLPVILEILVQYLYWLLFPRLWEEQVHFEHASVHEKIIYAVEQIRARLAFRYAIKF